MKCGKVFSIAVVMMLACIAGAQVADAPDEVRAGIPVNYTEAKVGWNFDPIKKQRVPAAPGKFNFGGIDVLPVIEKGFGLATVNYGDIDPDALSGLPFGVRTLQVNQFPVDAHMLLALIAPRPVLLQTGDTDRWSDPKGEFLAAVAATPVFKLLGKEGIDTAQLPPAGMPILNALGYFMHAGGHGSMPSDWVQFFKFMEMHFKPK